MAARAKPMARGASDPARPDSAITLKNTNAPANSVSSLARIAASGYRTLGTSSVDVDVGIVREILGHHKPSVSIAELDGMRRDEDLNDAPVLQPVTPGSGPVRVECGGQQFQEFRYVLLWSQVPDRL